MSVRFDASTDALSRIALPRPSITAFTLMGWAYSLGSVGAFSGALSFGNASAGGFYMIGRNMDTNRLQIYNASGGATGTAAWAISTWAHIAMTCAGTGANLLLGYLNGVLDITTTGASFVNAEKLYVGSSNGPDPFNGRMAAVKIYNAVLTASEIATEMGQYLPVNPTNLNNCTPLLTHTDVQDYGGLNATWTVDGTLTTEDGPPIPWMLRQPRRTVRAAVAVARKAPPPGRRPWRFARRAA